MNTNAAIAVAILAMVAIPIGLGYVLAYDETEKEGWQTGDTYNLSELALNAEAPYYLPSTSPANNGLMYGPGFNVLQSPDYFSTSTEIPSSIPLYNVSSSRLGYDFTSGRTVNVSTLMASGDSISGGISVLPFDASLYRIVASGISVNGSPVAGSYIHVAPTDASGQRMWAAYDGVFKPIVTAPTLTITTSGSSFQVLEGTATPLTDTWSAYSYVLDEDSPVWNLLTLAITLSNGDTVYYTGNNVNASGLGFAVSVNADGVSFSSSDASSVVAYAGNYAYGFSAVVTDTYADPAQGWAFPNNNAVWFNGQMNDSVIMYVQTPGLPTYFDMDIYSNIGEFTGDTISWDGQYRSITLNGVTKELGLYDFMRLEISRDTVTVSGLNAWPTMYYEPNLINTISFDRENPSLIYALGGEVRDYNTSFRLHFRVDTTEVLAGYFPITRDYTLNITQLFPGDDAFSVELASVGVYGSQITIAGTAYDVEDGAIIVDGQKFRLSGLLITIAQGDGQRIISLNGKEVATSQSGATIGFVGEWSVSLRGYSMERITTVSMEWQPGEFGLDSSGFTIVGLITCAGAFLVLGSTGSRSLSKALLLLIVCGFGAWFFLSWM